MNEFKNREKFTELADQIEEKLKELSFLSEENIENTISFIMWEINKKIGVKNND